MDRDIETGSEGTLREAVRRQEVGEHTASHPWHACIPTICHKECDRVPNMEKDTIKWELNTKQCGGNKASVTHCQKQH